MRLKLVQIGLWFSILYEEIIDESFQKEIKWKNQSGKFYHFFYHYEKKPL